MKWFVSFILLLVIGIFDKANAQNVYVSPVARQQFFTNTGIVAAGYKLCTLVAGTTTPATTYSDTVPTALPNPITLNSAGRPQTGGGSETAIYLNVAVSYKFILYASGTGNTCNGSAVGTLIWSQDKIPGFLNNAWIYSPATNFPVDVGKIYPSNLVTDNPNLLLGSSVTDVSLTGATFISIGSGAGFINATSAANASVMSIGAVTGLYSSIASNKTGTGSYLPLAFFLGGTQTVTFTTTGSVGIGTTTPLFTLDVRGTSQFTGLGASGVSTLAAYGTTGQYAASLVGSSASSNSYGLVVTAGTTSADLAVQVRKLDFTTILRIPGDGRILHALSTSDTGVDGIVTGSIDGFSAVSAALNASVLNLGVVPGGYTSIASTKSGTGTNLPMAFFTNSAEKFRLLSNAGAQVIVGATTTDLSLSTDSYVVAVSGGAGFVAANTSANATTLALGVLNTTETSIVSGRTGGGTYAPLKIYTGGSLRFTLDTSGNLTTTGHVTFTGLTSGGAQDYLCFTTATSEIEQGTATCTVSSARYKHDFESLDSGLATVLRMPTYSFIRNDHPELGRMVGLKAEDVAVIEPRLVILDREGRPDRVLYENYTAILTKAIQELEERVRKVESR